MNAVPGASLRDQAIAVAGALAELGVHEIVSASQTLKCRETDLPQVLCEAPAKARWMCAAAGVEIARVPSGLAWSVVDRAKAAAFQLAMQRAQA